MKLEKGVLFSVDDIMKHTKHTNSRPLLSHVGTSASAVNIRRQTDVTDSEKNEN